MNHARGLKSTAEAFGAIADLSRLGSAYSAIGTFGTGGAGLKAIRNVFEGMGIQTGGAADSRPPSLARSIPVAECVDGLPASVGDVDVVVRGDRSSFVMELAFRGDTWMLEGAGATAELTGVRGRRLPERVPDWVVAVAREFDIREVSLFNA